MIGVSGEAPVLEVNGLVKHFGVTRGLINHYFGTNLPLLPNRSRFSSYEEPFTYSGSLE